MGDQERGRRRPLDVHQRSGQEPQSKIFRNQSDRHTPGDRDRSDVSSSRRASTSHGASTYHGASTSRGTGDSTSRDASTSRGSDIPAVSVSHNAPVRGEGSGPQNARRRIDHYEIVNSRPADVLTKRGEEGKPIKLISNFYSLKTRPQWRIIHYHVNFEPEIAVVRVRCGVLSQHAPALGTGYLFDGMQLFTTKKFEQDVTVLKATSKQGVDYTITIKSVGIISSVEPRFLQVLNLILRRSMKGLKLEQVGRNLFDPHARVPLREFSLELWPGYETSIRQHETDILLCAEITHKVMRTETVYDIMRRTSANPSTHQEEFRVNVLGLIVLTDYNNKTYRINDVDFAQTPRTTFSCKGKDVSFVEYYQTKYNIRIRDQNQPLLLSKNRDKAQNSNANEIVILIPELCRVTGLTDSMRSNFQLMRAMSNHTRMNPSRRIERLQTFNQRLQTTAESSKVLTDWNMELSQNLVQVQGRVIEPQNIVFKSNKVCAGEQADWTRYFRDQQMFTTPKNGLDRWAVIAPQRNLRDLRQLLENLNRVARGMGFQISSPREVMIYDDRTGSYIQALDDCTRSDPKLVLCIVPSNNVERYSSIKKRGCVDRSVPTQVVTTRANQKGMSVATKIAIQINCKLGYTPWMIAVPMAGLMTMGFDIAKCTRDRNKAYGALVASMDLQRNATFFSTVAECSAYDVLANNLWPMVLKALRKYREEQNALPARIIFYRDGVSSGSLKQLFEYEVKDIVEKLDAEYQKAEANPPKFAYIVVTKSSNTRFFGDRRENPPPGTVVDDVVTLPERYDFYLVSQTVRQGTVSPTSYNVLYSKIHLSPDRIQKLTYKMCHLYYNWSGTTRVPAVCQYAKKLATLVGTNLHAIPQNALEKKFYYL
ncbi:protein piwi [Drosophila grimshawi]|uniref:GH10762 n=1 Tax=Drosophila grimshawi TaxID=7222 RepID=B4JBE1_DROGR|nr:protein piwi [Drosophila grimshawi]EDW02946.1 GH10762 [Drosophila grimshawi]